MVLSGKYYIWEKLKLNNDQLTAEERLIKNEKMTQLVNIFIMTGSNINNTESICVQLRDNLDRYRKEFDIPDDYFTLADLTDHVNKNFAGIFGTDTEKGVSLFLMNTMSVKTLKETFVNMVMGINQDNYLQNIYKIVTERPPQNLPHLSAISNLMNKFAYFKRMEMNYSLAKFVEMLYKTKEGKVFIESFNDAVTADFSRAFSNKFKPESEKVKGVSEKDIYYQKLFKKMNDASFYPMFLTDSKGEIFYRFQKKDTFNGIFLGFDENQLKFSVGLKLDEQNLAQGLHYTHHGIISKTLTDAVYKSLKALSYQKNGDKIKLMKEYWEQVVNKNDKSKHYFITHALFRLLSDYNIIKNGAAQYPEFLKAVKNIEKGIVNGQLKGMMLTLPANLFINKKLGIDVKEGDSDLNIFFAGFPDCAFHGYYHN